MRRELKLTLTNDVLSVEHTIVWNGSSTQGVLEAMEDALDEMNYKLSVCEQALAKPDKEAA